MSFCSRFGAAQITTSSKVLMGINAYNPANTI